jgi:polyhydroxyalkanoate synthesis repressor PhaR
MASRPGAPRLIKKYGNRRLYDTAESRYITLDELAETVRRGNDVRIVDAKTEVDLTQATLTQILIEGRNVGRFLSVPLLIQLVRLGDDMLSEFLGRYLSTAMELYLQLKQGAQAAVPYGYGSGPLAFTGALARLFTPGGWGGSSSVSEPYPPIYGERPSPAAPAPSASDSGLAELREELAQMKEELRRQAPARRRKPPKR